MKADSPETGEDLSIDAVEDWVADRNKEQQ